MVTEYCIRFAVTENATIELLTAVLAYVTNGTLVICKRNY